MLEFITNDENTLIQSYVLSNEEHRFI